MMPQAQKRPQRSSKKLVCFTDEKTKTNKTMASSEAFDKSEMELELEGRTHN